MRAQRWPPSEIARRDVELACVSPLERSLAGDHLDHSQRQAIHVRRGTDRAIRLLEVLRRAVFRGERALSWTDARREPERRDLERGASADLREPQICGSNVTMREALR